MVCREYILLRDDPDFQPKRWIQGNMRIGLVWEVTTSFQHFKYGIEVRIWSVNQDNPQSWVRISYGTVKYVIDSIQDNMEIFPQIYKKSKFHKRASRRLQSGQRQKKKQQPRVLVGTTATIPKHERRWIDIEPSKQELASYNLFKKSDQSSATQSNVTEGRRWSN